MNNLPLFSKLSSDIQWLILKNLTIKDILKLRSTCKYMYHNLPRSIKKIEIVKKQKFNNESSKFISLCSNLSVLWINIEIKNPSHILQFSKLPLKDIYFPYNPYIIAFLCQYRDYHDISGKMNCLNFYFWNDDDHNNNIFFENEILGAEDMKFDDANIKQQFDSFISFCLSILKISKIRVSYLLSAFTYSFIFYLQIPCLFRVNPSGLDDESINKLTKKLKKWPVTNCIKSIYGQNDQLFCLPDQACLGVEFLGIADIFDVKKLTKRYPNLKRIKVYLEEGISGQERQVEETISILREDQIKLIQVNFNLDVYVPAWRKIPPEIMNKINFCYVDFTDDIEDFGGVDLNEIEKNQKEYKIVYG